MYSNTEGRMYSNIEATRGAKDNDHHVSESESVSGSEGRRYSQKFSRCPKKVNKKGQTSTLQ